MLSKKAIEQLKKAKKRRARRPVSRPALSAKLSASAGLERRMVNNHGDVLQNIEFMLVDAYYGRDDVDDSVVVAALRAAIADRSSDEPIVN